MLSAPDDPRDGDAPMTLAIALLAVLPEWFRIDRRVRQARARTDRIVTYPDFSGQPFRVTR